MQTWSTDSVEPSQRLDYWVGAICEAFLEMSCDSHQDQPFSGKLTHLQADSIYFSQVIAQPAKVVRSRQAVARSKEHPFYLICDLSNVWQASQGGEQITLEAGDLLLVDSSQSYRFNFPKASNNISVQMPRTWLAQWIEQDQLPALKRIAGHRGWGAPLSALCKQIGVEPNVAHDLPARVLNEQVGAMLAAALGNSSAPALCSSKALVDQALNLMRQQLADPLLNSDSISRHLHLSTRSLFRHFATEKITFHQSLLKMRMLYARELLMLRRFDNLTVEAIGRRCGYVEPSNFVRQFHRQFGETPAKWRKQLRPGRN